MKKTTFLLLIFLSINFCSDAQNKFYTHKDSVNAMSDALLKMGTDLADRNNWEDAMLWYNKSLELNPNNSNAYYDRAAAKYNLKDYRGAILDCNKVIGLDKNYAEAYYIRAMAYGSLGVQYKENCCLDLSKAGELGYEEAYSAIQKLCND